MIEQLASFSDELTFIIILVILLIVAIIIGIKFELNSIFPTLAIFAILLVYLYFNDVISIGYAAIGYLIFAIIVYIAAKNNRRLDQ